MSISDGISSQEIGENVTNTLQKAVQSLNIKNQKLENLERELQETRNNVGQEAEEKFACYISTIQQLNDTNQKLLQLLTQSNEDCAYEVDSEQSESLKSLLQQRSESISQINQDYPEEFFSQFFRLPPFFENVQTSKVFKEIQQTKNEIADLKQQMDEFQNDIYSRIEEFSKGIERVNCQTYQHQ